MNLRDWLRLQRTNSDSILEDLSDRQFLGPHKKLGEVLDASTDALGFCPKAAKTAVSWLQLDPGKSIGRLKRAEIIQLARSIHRFWQKTLTTEPHESHIA